MSIRFEIATAASKAELERLMSERKATVKAILAAVDAGKDLEISPGAYICSASDMTADQERWDDEDPHKHTDFSTSPYWVTTDSGDDPIPIETADDLLEMCNDCEFDLTEVASEIQSSAMNDPFVQGKASIQPSN